MRNAYWMYDEVTDNMAKKINPNLKRLAELTHNPDLKMPADYVSVLIVGAGPAGLACAIQLKAQKPDIDICVVE